MKAKRLFSLLTLSATLGIVFGVSSNKEIKVARATDEPKLCIFNEEPIPMDYDSVSDEYYAVNINLNSNDEFVIIHEEIEYGYTELFDDKDYGELFYESDNHICSRYSSTFSVYFFRDYDYSEGDFKIRISLDDPILESNLWAQSFVEDVGCVSTYDQYPSNWDDFAISFYELSDDAKDIFIEANASNAENASFVQKAAFIHDMCVIKYDYCVTFMARDGGGGRYPIISQLSRNYEFNMSALIIVITSTVSVTTLLALLIFKKSKSKR